MAQLMDSIRYMTKEIGPRPAGTSEEQQTALCLTEQFQKQSGFSAGIEEFQRKTRPDLAYAILAAVMIVITILAMFFQALAIPAFILAAAAAALYVLELSGTPLLSRVLASGSSQNVVAKYQPNPESETSSRAITRKIILVAHYDSGRVTPGLLKRFDKLKVGLNVIAGGGMVAAAVLMLLRIFVAISGGGVLVLLNVVSGIALVVSALPILALLLRRAAAFNEGANNNASGAAALVEVARRISQGCVSEADLVRYAEDVTVHGEAAARSAGLVPEGATLTYEAQETVGDDASEEERLLAAKAAIAALTGRPVERRVYSSVAEEAAPAEPDQEPVIAVGDSQGSFTQISDEEFATAFKEYRTGSIPPVHADAQPVPAEGEAAPAEAAPEPAAEEDGQDVGGFQNVPSWFAAAQKNAKKPAGAAAEVHRSRFTEAMENAERERIRQEEAIAAAEEAAREAERAAREAEAAAAIAAAAKQKADAAQAAKEAQAEEARLQDATRAMSPEDLPGAMPASQPAEVVVEEAVEVEVPEGNEGSAPRVPQGEAAAVGARESALQAELVAEETVQEAPEAAAAPEPEAKDEPLSRLDRLRNLRTNVPSLSGVIRTKDEARKAAVKAVPDIESRPAAAERTAASAPARAAEPPKARAAVDVPRIIDEEPLAVSSTPLVGDEVDTGVIAGRAEVDYDMVVSTDFNPQTETDFAANLDQERSGRRRGAEDLDAPLPRAQERKGSGFFDRFRHKRDEGADDMGSPQEWLGVDEDFEARKVGRARGSWESFRADDGANDPFSMDDHDTFDDFGTDDAPRKRRGRNWEGGAASRRSLGHVDTKSGRDAEADAGIPDAPPETERDRFITGEIESIYHFRNPAFNTEIWFVAMGSDDNDGHDGVHAFLEEHKAEMRGSTVIEVESLGAGKLSMASREGAFKKVSASSRVKRYTREVVASTGIALEDVDMSGKESIASIVQKAGFQSMHLFGAEDGLPALKGSADDLLENVDELVLDDYIGFVYELLKR